jgi:hypothetical protein
MGAYQDIGQQIGELVERKQAAYGDSFGKSGSIMLALYPDGISPGQIDDALTVVRVVDKLFRIATDRDALGESPWRDIAGYSLLSVRRIESAIRPVQDKDQATGLLKRVCSACGDLSDAFVVNGEGYVFCLPCHTHRTKVSEIMDRQNEHFRVNK